MVAGDDFEGLYYVLVPESFGDLALPKGARALTGTVNGDDLDGHVFAPEVALERTSAPHGREAAAPDHLGQRVAPLSFDVARLCHYLIGYCIAYQLSARFEPHGGGVLTRRLQGGVLKC
jgi:hypothetical protein